MPTIVCPTCGERLDVPPELAEGPVRCGACDSVLDPPPRPARSPRSPGGLPRARRIDRPRDDDRPPRRKSRVRLLVVLGVVGLACAGCFGGLANVGWRMENPAWTRFSPPDGKFEVEFPGGPPRRTNSLAHAGRWPADVTVFASERNFGREGYLVAAYDLHPGFDPDNEDDVEAELNAGLENLGALPDGCRSLVRTPRTSLTLAGRPALEVSGHYEDHNFRRCWGQARAVIVDRRMCLVFARVSGDSPPSAKIDRFFVSFVPTPAPGLQKK